MKNIADIYVRLSDEDRDKKNSNDESESIQNQKSMLISYCMERNWEINKIYCDEDYSGADRSRPDFNAMIKDCEERKVNIVLCKTQSRFSRDMEVIEHYIHGKFPEWGIRFVSIVDHADTSIKGNKKARQINGLINEWYLEDLSDNIRRTLNHKKKNGEFCGSFAPYGYAKDPLNKNKLVVDPEAAQVVKNIFDMFLDGMGYMLIAQTLNQRGIPNPSEYKRQKGLKYGNHCSSSLRVTGSLWTNDTIYYILRRQEYNGTLCQNRSENSSYKNPKRIVRSEDMWTKCKGAVEPIIDEDTWNRTRAKLASRTRAEKRSGEKHIFSGKLFCDVCGSSMYKNQAPASKGGYQYINCRTHYNSPESCGNNRAIRYDLLEHIVIGEINKLLDKYYDPKEITVEDDSRQKQLDKLLKEKAEIEAVIRRKNKAVELMYADRADGIISTDEFVRLKNSAQENINNLTNNLGKVKTKIESHQKEAEDVSKKERIISKYSHITALNHDIIDTFIKEIRIGKFISSGVPRKITIVWNFDNYADLKTNQT